MKSTLLFTAALAATVGLVALEASAQHQEAQVQEQQRLSVAQIATMLEEQGYSVLELELERGRYDVEMLDGNGLRVEAYLDSATGSILPDRNDYDDYQSNRDDDDHGERDDH